MKTGYTQASGFNLAASAVRGGRRLVAVVIGGRTAGARDASMVDLLDPGFARGPRRPLDEIEVAEREPTRPSRTKRAALAATDSQLPTPQRPEVVVASLDGGAAETVSPSPPRSKKARAPSRRQALRQGGRAQRQDACGAPGRCQPSLRGTGRRISGRGAGAHRHGEGHAAGAG